MSYIKTRKGVYEVRSIEDEPVNIESKEPYKDTVKMYLTTDGEWFSELDILKEAKTIKGLCDMYIVEYIWKLNNTKYRHLEQNYGSAKDYFNSRIKDGDLCCKIYGMTWISGKYGEPILKAVANFTTSKDGDLYVGD